MFINTYSNNRIVHHHRIWIFVEDEDDGDDDLGATTIKPIPNTHTTGSVRMEFVCMCNLHPFHPYGLFLCTRKSC